MLQRFREPNASTTSGNTGIPPMWICLSISSPPLSVRGASLRTRPCQRAPVVLHETTEFTGRSSPDILALAQPDDERPITFGADAELGRVHPRPGEERFDLFEKLFRIVHRDAL